MIRALLYIITWFPMQQSNNRLLTIYAQSANNSYYLQQIQFLQGDKPGLDDRNVVIETHIYNKNNSSFFSKSHIKSDFVVVLTGKDGGEKYRSEHPITLEKLYAIIDAMPMRKQEMLKKH